MELLEVAVGNVFVDAVLVWPFAVGEVMGAEDAVEEWNLAGEVDVPG